MRRTVVDLTSEAKRLCDHGLRSMLVRLPHSKEWFVKVTRHEGQELVVYADAHDGDPLVALLRAGGHAMAQTEKSDEDG